MHAVSGQVHAVQLETPLSELRTVRVNEGRLVCRHCSKSKEYIGGYKEKVRICDLCKAKIKNERFNARKENRATLHLCRINE